MTAAQADYAAKGAKMPRLDAGLAFFSSLASLKALKTTRDAEAAAAAAADAAALAQAMAQSLQVQAPPPQLQEAAIVASSLV